MFLAKGIVHVSVSIHAGPDISQCRWGEDKRHKNRMQMKWSAYGLRLPTPKDVTLEFNLTVIQLLTI